MFQIKFKKRLSILLLTGLIVLCTLPNFAETADQEVVVEKPTVTELNLNMIRNSFIENSSELRTLKDAMNDIGQGLDSYDNNILYLLIYKNRVSGNNDLRTGKYYEFAYPRFVAIENYRAQYENLERTKDLIEAKLSNGADQYISKYKLLNEKIDLYEDMISRTELTYQSIQNKTALGLLTSRDSTNAKLELENLKYEKEKLELTKDILKDTILSKSAFDEEGQYKIQMPVFTSNKFESENISIYYDTAAQNSMTLAEINRTLSAMEVEGKYIDLYKYSVLNSDQLEYETRLSDTKQSLEDEKKTLYKRLRDELSEMNRIEDAMVNADTQIEYNKVMLKKLEQMEDLGLVIDTDRLGYQLKVFQSELEKKSLETDRYLIGQEIELLIYNGVDLRREL